MRNKEYFCIRKRRKHSMLCSLLFGALILLWGITILVNVIFHIHIPIFGIAFGILLIYVGIQLISGPTRSRWCCWSYDDDTASCNHSAFMGSFQAKVNDDIESKKFPLEYKTMFGNSKIDLSTLTLEKLKNGNIPAIINVDTFFGKTELILNKSIPTRIIAKSACGKAELPDKTVITFGTHTYDSHPGEQPLIIINCSTHFGETEIKQN